MRWSAPPGDGCAKRAGAGRFRASVHGLHALPHVCFPFFFQSCLEWILAFVASNSGPTSYITTKNRAYYSVYQLSFPKKYLYQTLNFNVWATNTSVFKTTIFLICGEIEVDMFFLKYYKINYNVLGILLFTKLLY
jgi:hypothetical protein